MIKADLVMWAKNGAATLPQVLACIDEVVPRENVCHKILVDDHSVDDTVKIAKEFGWQVYPNPQSGISSGANEALRHVDTDTFISFEQDLLLSKSWWNKIPSQLKGNVAVVSGLRFSVSPKYLKALQIYSLKKLLPRTLDNSIWKTKVVRDVGGFPDSPTSSGVDTLMLQKICDVGWNWVVDCSVQSIHLHSGLANEMKRQYWYGLAYNTVKNHVAGPTKFGVMLHCLLSPLMGFKIMVNIRSPQVVFAYPLLRLSHAKGMLRSR
jgi:glycosyltransferase involved in cell wall biosynthesis